MNKKIILLNLFFVFLILIISLTIVNAGCCDEWGVCNDNKQDCLSSVGEWYKDGYCVDYWICCGDNVCNTVEGESCSNCPDDCGSCALPSCTSSGGDGCTHESAPKPCPVPSVLDHSTWIASGEDVSCAEIQPAYKPVPGYCFEWRCVSCNSGYEWDGSMCIPCTPYYYNNCDYTNGCGGTITVPSGYNSCDLDSDIACGTETNCNDGIDNDCDGDTDCWDFDCNWVTRSCQRSNSYGICYGTETCYDGWWDECSVDYPSQEDCTDGIDNDCDGDTDCWDSDCEGEICALGYRCDAGYCDYPCFNTETNCGNTIDEDCDGSIDCLDIADCDGQTCGTNMICDSSGSCVLIQKSNGEICSSHSECLSGNCIGPNPNGPGDPFRCAPADKECYFNVPSTWLDIGQSHNIDPYTGGENICWDKCEPGSYPICTQAGNYPQCGTDKSYCTDTSVLTRDPSTPVLECHSNGLWELPCSDQGKTCQNGNCVTACISEGNSCPSSTECCNYPATWCSSGYCCPDGSKWDPVDEMCKENCDCKIDPTCDDPGYILDCIATVGIGNFYQCIFSNKVCCTVYYGTTTYDYVPEADCIEPYP